MVMKLALYMALCDIIGGIWKNSRKLLFSSLLTAQLACSPVKGEELVKQDITYEERPAQQLVIDGPKRVNYQAFNAKYTYTITLSPSKEGALEPKIMDSWILIGINHAKSEEPRLYVKNNSGQEYMEIVRKTPERLAFEQKIGEVVVSKVTEMPGLESLTEVISTSDEQIKQRDEENRRRMLNHKTLEICEEVVLYHVQQGKREGIAKGYSHIKLEIPIVPIPFDAREVRAFDLVVVAYSRMNSFEIGKTPEYELDYSGSVVVPQHAERNFSVLGLYHVDRGSVIFCHDVGKEKNPNFTMREASVVNIPPEKIKFYE